MSFLAKHSSAVALLLLVLAQAAIAQIVPPAAPAAAPATTKKATTMHATGPFEVKMSPETGSERVTAAKLGRQSLDKQFSGDLQASSVGEMLMAIGEIKGSAGYVAIERVEGTLNGRSGSFVLQHSGIMNRGAPSLVITVVPDSGTGELTGLAGTMGIQNDAGKHRYTFDYTLP
jgi:hypothetical protein